MNNNFNNLIINVLNEGFNFDEDLQDDSSFTGLSHNIVKSFDGYAICEHNMQYQIKDLLFGLYNKMPSPAPTLTARGIINDEVGPCWYNKKIYDINTLLRKDTQIINDIEVVKPIKSKWEKLLDNGWHVYFNETTRDNFYWLKHYLKDRRELPEIHSIINQKIIALCNLIGITDLQDKNVTYTFAISPDNGIIYVEHIGHKDLVYDNSAYDGVYYNTNKAIWSIIFFSGLVEYMQNTEKVRLDQKDFKNAKNLETLTATLIRYYGISVTNLVWNKGETNRLILLTEDENGHLVLPLGSKDEPFGPYIKNQQTVPQFNQGTTFPACMMTNKKDCLALMHHFFTTFRGRDDFDNLNCIINPSLQVYVSSDNHAKMFFTPNLNIIEKIFGKNIADLCKDRGVIFQNLPKYPEKHIKIYGVLWLDDAFTSVYEQCINKTLKLGDLRKMVSNWQDFDDYLNQQ